MIVSVFKRCEIILHSDKTYANPFMDVDVDAVFTHADGTVITLPGFWNGENEWKVRFSPDRPGAWTYTVSCSDKDNASLTETGTIQAVEGEKKTDLEKHGFVTLQKGKRYFERADGTPFFWVGDTHWQMPDYERLHECNYPGCTCGNQFKHLVDDRVKKGFTVYQTYFDSAESDGGGNKRVHPWWTEKYTLINPRSFNETMDVMMEYLADNDITVAMGFGLHTSTIGRYQRNPVPLLAFARYCVARYACYPVLWITAQEITVDPEGFALWQQVGDLVGKLDGYHHPNSAHMYPMISSDPRAQELENDDWHNYWTLQAGHGGVGRLQKRTFYQSYYEMPDPKPFIEGECHYEDIYCGGFCGCDASRIGAWQAAISGAAGFTYGVTGVWAIGWNQRDDQGWLTYSPEPWYVGMDKPGSREMTYLRKFFEYVDFTTLTPSFGHEHGSFEMRRFVNIAHRGQDVFVYQFFYADNETGLLTGLKPNTEYQARWYDPIMGKFIDLPAQTTDAEGRTFVPAKPSRRDWVLLLNCVDLGAYETEDYPEIKAPLPRANAFPDAVIPAKLTVSSEEDEHPAKNLSDGDPDTFWRPFAHSTSVTFLFDLGEKKHVDYLNLWSKMPDYRFYDFRVETSDDGENWALRTERVADSLVIGGQYPDYYEDVSGEYRYLRLFILSRNMPIKMEFTRVALFSKEAGK